VFLFISYLYYYVIHVITGVSYKSYNWFTGVLKHISSVKKYSIFNDLDNVINDFTEKKIYGRTKYGPFL